jgi:hypothetical protein
MHEILADIVGSLLEFTQETVATEYYQSRSAADRPVACFIHRGLLIIASHRNRHGQVDSKTSRHLKSGCVSWQSTCAVMLCCNVMRKPVIPSQKRVFVDSRHLHTLITISEIKCSGSGENRAANIRIGYAYVISDVCGFGPDIVKSRLTRR